MRATCLVVRAAAPTADLSGLSPPSLESHVTACLSCQAEMARYGKLRRQLAALADVVETAPAPLVPGVEEAIASGQTPIKSGGSALPPRPGGCCGRCGCSCRCWCGCGGDPAPSRGLSV